MIKVIKIPASIMDSPLILPVAGILVVVFLLWKFGIFKKLMQGSAFKRVKLDEVVFDDLKAVMKYKGVKQKKKKLSQGYLDMGQVLRVGSFTLKPNPDKDLGLGTNDYFVMSVRRNDIISFVKSLFGFGIDIFVVDKNLVKIKDNYNVYPTANIFKHLGVYVVSELGKKTVEHIAFKYAYTRNLEEIVNWTNKLVYLEVMHTKKIDKADKFTKLEKERWSNKLEELTKEE